MVATLRYIDARTAVDIIVLIAEVLILENDAHIAILKNVNNTLRFEPPGRSFKIQYQAPGWG
ncbi:MAG: hypothetical protein H8D67_24080 [Deltaproteobacteria bacterium]|nr:hypothetical protein [Deltaproteobacteria bacterium]